MSVGRGSLQSANWSNHLRPPRFHCSNPALSNKPLRANLCCDSAGEALPARRLGRSIIKTILCCHGDRDLNKLFMCVFLGSLGIFWKGGWCGGGFSMARMHRYAPPAHSCGWSLFIFLVMCVAMLDWKLTRMNMPTSIYVTDVSWYNALHVGLTQRGIVVVVLTLILEDVSASSTGGEKAVVVSLATVNSYVGRVGSPFIIVGYFPFCFAA